MTRIKEMKARVETILRSTASGSDIPLEVFGWRCGDGGMDRVQVAYDGKPKWMQLDLIGLVAYPITDEELETTLRSELSRIHGLRGEKDKIGFV